MSKQFNEGDVVLYQNGDEFKLGIIKRKRDEESFWVWYHTGDTAALTNINDLYSINNIYVFDIYRRKYNNTKVITEKSIEKDFIKRYLMSLVRLFDLKETETNYRSLFTESITNFTNKFLNNHFVETKD